MKIGILTFHRAYNYGAYLQACALCGRLNMEEGIEAEIIDYRMPSEAKRYDVRRFPLKKKLYQIKSGTFFFNRTLGKRFEEAMRNPCMKLSSESLESASLKEFSGFADAKYDAIVVGSDEVWKTDSYRGFPTAYWLFGDLHCRKLSYAASARVDFAGALNGEDYRKVREALSDFEFAGVRDTATQDAVKAAIDDPEKVHLCCDPTFLFDFNIPESDVLERIRSRKEYKQGRKNVMVMLDDNAAADYVREQLGSRYNLISVYQPHRGYLNFPDLDPFEWLYLIKNADFVIASFFHAVCFCIKYDRPFIAMGTKGKKSKLGELLGTDSLKERYVQMEDHPDLEPLVCRVTDSGQHFGEYTDRLRKTFDPFLHALRNGGKTE